MSKAEKLLAKALKNPGSLSYKEFVTLLQRSGWEKVRQVGSHEQWVWQGNPLTINNRKGEAVEYQVKQFLATRWGDK